jgi:aspartate kinase
MALIVQKYGGTSVANIERIQAVAKKIKTFKNQGNDVVVSVSAMSGETNRLIALAKEIQTTANMREMDMLLTTGEQVTISLLAMALQEIDCDAISYTGAQVKILTDESHGKARIKSIDSENIQNSLKEGKVVIVAGFQGVTKNNHITTLGRGGSDTTAVALAAALKADECQIYTDVDGVYTTDPRIEPNAKKIDTLSYEEMLEMASLGSKILQIRSVEFASKYQVPLRVLSSLIDKPVGTLITNEDKVMEKALISGIAHNKDEAKLSLIGVPDTPGIAAKILGAISKDNIEVDMIVQSVSAREGLTNFAFTVHKDSFVQATKILEKLCHELEAISMQNDDKVVKISLVGLGMRSHAGIASKMFEILQNENINIQMISTSEIKISVIIEEKYLELAVRSLHSAFDLDK